MANVLLIDYKKCNGCNECETACAMHFAGVADPKHSRIRVIKTDIEEVFIPVTCQQCKDAPCLDACPATAIYRDTELNRVLVDQDKCIGCKTCVTVCPFGGMSFNRETQQVMKCDFCGGEPACVKVCEPKAIIYSEVTDQSITKRQTIAEKYFSYFRNKGAEVNT